MYLIYVTWFVLKLAGLFLAAFLVYNLKFIFKPYFSRRRFKKYKNVYMYDKAPFVIGDASRYMEDMKKNRVNFYHQIEYAMELKDIDFRVSFIADRTFINVFSMRALKEFVQKVPKFIDRKSLANVGFGKIFPRSSVHQKTGAEWRKRRESFQKHIGINFSSKHIPLMIDCIGDRLNTWKDAKSQKNDDLLKDMADTTFAVITKVFFGENISEEMGEIEYIDPTDSTTKMMKFDEFYTNLAKSLMGNRFTLKGLLLPFLDYYNLTKPYSTNYQNLQKLWKVLSEYLDKHPEQDSVYNKLINQKGLTKDYSFQDSLGILFAGHETSSHTISSGLYFLYKNPVIKEKLMEELKEFVGKSHDEIKTLLTREKIDKLEYLHLVIKEILRIDPPAMDAIPYEVIQDTELCGVEFKKGDMLNMNILSRHFDPAQWQEPLKFIPERFDPESEYFNAPETNKGRDPFAWIPFSVHVRKCSGQTFAMLEAKVFILYLLSRVEFTFPKELLESDTSFFSIVSQLKLNFSAKLRE
ncbi:unnamed protein product [Moneuplotes crassus]|uniref:Cytochrome P450 n=1 Tax=Euplotes crassus TaxID=5936 RepID=A0AAD1U9W7_EUPCR|nr:unnamed protein product [Moneuplotes crassus]